ncbi:MAG: FG-GAP repeat domain-containing protein, partial [bacterium]
MVNLLLLTFLVSGFNLKWLLPKGTNDFFGRMCIVDTDRDGNYELVFRPCNYGNNFAYICELHLPDIWEVDSFFPEGVCIRDIGDFDSDGLYDLVVHGCASCPPPVITINIFESSDSFSYPTHEVWRDTLGGPGCGTEDAIQACDLDRDGIPELLSCDGNVTNALRIYECIGDNKYDTIFTTPEDPFSNYACGDFDSDSKIEFAFCNSGYNYMIYESPANNTYEKVWVGQHVTSNLKDCFSVADADGDGKMEFVAKGFNPPPPPTYIDAFIIEATSDNTYEVIKHFNFSNGYELYYGGYSEAGDVDGDSVPEIILEASSEIYIIKSAGDDSFYVWQTLPGNATGSNIRVFDLDRNGLNEIIISGNNQTRIYEKTPFVTWFCPEPYDTFYANDTVYPRWKLDETISLDSLRLYWSHPQLGCHLIYQGLPTDTICQWAVPDTQSNMSNRLWLVVKGYGRYDSTYSPVFYIRRGTAIKEMDNQDFSIAELQLRGYPNPA